MEESKMYQGYMTNAAGAMGGWTDYNQQQNANMYGQSERNAGMMGMQGLGMSNQGGADEQNMNYYQEYCKLFVANVVLTNQIKELIAEKNELASKISRLEANSAVPKETPITKQASLASQASQPDDGKTKRTRRVASEIQRHFKCPGENCQKSYGTEGALLQHVRLKHPDIVEDVKAKLSK